MSDQPIIQIPTQPVFQIVVIGEDGREEIKAPALPEQEAFAYVQTFNSSNSQWRAELRRVVGLVVSNEPVTVPQRKDGAA